MLRRIVIDEDVPGNLKAGASSLEKERRIDVQDIMLLAGILFWESAAVVIWWPSALILAGAFCLFFVYMKARGPNTKKK